MAEPLSPSARVASPRPGGAAKDPLAIKIAVGRSRELTLSREPSQGVEPRYQLAIVQRDGEQVRYQGTTTLTRSGVFVYLLACQRLAEHIDRYGLPGDES